MATLPIKVDAIPKPVKDLDCQKLLQTAGVAMSGFLRKRPDRSFMNGMLLNKRKWTQKFVILASGCVYIYHSEGSPKCERAASLFGYDGIKADDSDPNNPWAFVLSNNLEDREKTFWFAAPCEEQRRMWMECFQKEMYAANSAFSSHNISGGVSSMSAISRLSEHDRRRISSFIPAEIHEDSDSEGGAVYEDPSDDNISGGSIASVKSSSSSSSNKQRPSCPDNYADRRHVPPKPSAGNRSVPVPPAVQQSGVEFLPPQPRKKPSSTSSALPTSPIDCGSETSEGSGPFKNRNNHNAPEPLQRRLPSTSTVQSTAVDTNGDHGTCRGEKGCVNNSGGLQYETWDPPMNPVNASTPINASTPTASKGPVRQKPQVMQKPSAAPRPGQTEVPTTSRESASRPPCRPSQNNQVPLSERSVPPIPVSPPQDSSRSNNFDSQLNDDLDDYELNGGDVHDNGEDHCTITDSECMRNQFVRAAYCTDDPEVCMRKMGSINEEGVYMIRRSKSSQNDKTLAVRVLVPTKRIMKFTLVKKQNNHYTLSNDVNIFSSLEELLRFYCNNTLPGQQPVRLSRPYTEVYHT